METPEVGTAPAQQTPVPAASARPRARVSVLGILGELLITVGALVLLFVVWQVWIGDVIAGAGNNASAHAQASAWQESPEATSEPSASPDPTVDPAPAEPVIAPRPVEGEVFGIMYVPRFGSDFAVRMAGGVTREKTLDPIGIGHYDTTQTLGEVGNFAVAAHRTGYGGAPFLRIAELRVGDPIVIETADGWYTYRFRTLEYVKPTATSVLHPVPQDTVTGVGERYLTMTSCSPKHTIIERIVAYSVFDSFQPRADGPPEAIAGPAGTS